MDIFLHQWILNNVLWVSNYPPAPHLLNSWVLLSYRQEMDIDANSTNLKPNFFTALREIFQAFIV